MENEIKYSRISKELMTRELSEKFARFPNFVVTNYFGLSATDLNELRHEMDKISSEYLVIKNTIAKKVLDKAKIKNINDLITGGVGIGFIGHDVVEASKIIVGFSKKHEPFQIRGAYIEGKKLDAARLKELALLPSREVLLTMVLAAMQSPISGFVNVLSGTIRKFVYAVKAIKDKKESNKED